MLAPSLHGPDRRPSGARERSRCCGDDGGAGLGQVGAEVHVDRMAQQRGRGHRRDPEAVGPEGERVAQLWSRIVGTLAASLSLRNRSE